jgi:hypothetical protein
MTEDESFESLMTAIADCYAEGGAIVGTDEVLSWTGPSAWKAARLRPDPEGIHRADLLVALADQHDWLVGLRVMLANGTTLRWT